VTQPNNIGGFTAASSCANVTVAAVSGSTSSFTATAVTAATTGCTITITGDARTSLKTTLAATVAAPGGVQIRWSAPNYASLAAPVPQNAGPVNLIGTGVVFASLIAISETAFIQPFQGPIVSAGCGTNLTVAAATPNANLFAAVPSSSTVAYYTVSSAAPFTSAANCSISVGDSAIPASTGTIGVVATGSSGGVQ